MGEKVDRLKKVKNSEVYSFPIDPNPEKSLPYLQREIDWILLDNITDDELKLIFVGTSLGAWYAWKLSQAYNSRGILINPCYDPGEMLKKYELDPKVLAQYEPIEFSKLNDVYVALDDEVIDFDPIMENLKGTGPRKVTFVMNSNHRFIGKEFDDVVEDINNGE